MMFGDEESCSKKLKEVDEKDFREDEDIGKETKCHEIVNNNISHDDRNNEQMENRKKATIKREEIDENSQASFQINCGDDGVSELVENEESVDLTSVDVESIKLFNEKYSHVKIPSEKSEPSSDTLNKQPAEQEPLENETGKSKSNATSKQKLDNSSLNECKNATSSTAVLSSEQQHKLDTNSTLINGLQDKSVPAPTSTQSIPESGFSSILSSNPMFIGSLVTHNGSMYYQPNTGLSIPHISPGMNYHCYVMVPNRHDPNSTASIPDFLVNPNAIQVPLLTNCGQLTTSSRASIISLESFQRAYSMTSSGVCNPNSMVTIPINQPTNTLGTTTNTNVISLESLQQALCSVMLPTGVNPNSNLTIPLNQSSEVRPACSSSAVISSKATESISCSSNTVTSSLTDFNELQGLATSHSSTCTHDVETILVAEDQSSIRNMQDSKLSTVEDSCDTQDCRGSGSSQMSILTHDNMAEDQSSIRNMQDSKLSTVEDSCDTQDCRGSGSSQMSILTHDNMAEDQSSIRNMQDSKLSTVEDSCDTQDCRGSGSSQMSILTHDNMAEDQSYIRNVQDSRLSTVEDSCDTQDCRGLGSSQMSILTHDNMAEDQTYIRNMQDSRLSIAEDTCDTQDCKGSGSLQMSILTHDNMTEDQTYIRNMQDSRLSTVEDSCDTQDCRGLGSSQMSILTHDNMAEDQSYIRNMQDSRLSTVEDSCDTQDCRGLGSSQMSILTHDNMAEDQAYIRNMQDSRLSTVEDSCDTQDCRGLGSSQMSILTHDNMAEDQSYIRNMQDSRLSTVEDSCDTQDCRGLGSSQMSILTHDNMAEDQTYIRNMQDSRLSIAEDTCDTQDCKGLGSSQMSILTHDNMAEDQTYIRNMQDSRLSTAEDICDTQDCRGSGSSKMSILTHDNMAEDQAYIRNMQDSKLSTVEDSCDTQDCRGLGSSQMSILTHDNMAEDQSYIRNMQDSKLSTVEDICDTQDCRGSGSSQMSILTHDNMTEDQAYISEAQDQNSSTPADNSQNQVSTNSGSAQICIITEPASDTCQESSPNIPQGCSVSTPAHENGGCMSSELSYFATTTESASETDQESSTNILQDCSVSTPADENRVCNSSPSLPICSTAESASETCQESSSGVHQDCSVSTPADEIWVWSSPISRICSTTESTSENCQESSPNILQDCSLSTPADENRVCNSSPSPRVCSTAESVSETCQESSTNISQDCSVTIPVYASKEVPTEVEEEERCREESGDLPQEQNINEVTVQNTNDSSLSNSSSQFKHLPPKNSTLIRVSPQYSETKGCCSPLVRVSKNVSPLQPIRGNKQHYVITQGHDRRMVSEEGREKETENKVKIRRPIYLKGTPPQGYKRRLLTTAAKTTNYTNKVERKKCSSVSSSRSLITALQDQTKPEQKSPNHTTVKEPGSSELEKSLEDKTPKEAGVPRDLDTQKLETLSPSDPKTTFGPQTPNRTWACNDPLTTFMLKILRESSAKKEARNKKTPSKSISFETTTGCQKKEEPGTPNIPDTQEAPNKTGSPEAFITVDQTKTPINTQTPNKTPSNENSKTFKDQKTPNEFRTPNVKVFKATRTEDKEKKRNREHRNCLELRDEFQYLCRILPGTKRTWSRVQVLYQAIQYIRHMQEFLKGYGGIPNNGQLALDDKENDGTSLTCDQESISTDHVVPRSLDSFSLGQYWEFCMRERAEEQNSIPNFNVVENPEDLQVEENSIYILYPNTNTNEEESTGSCTPTEVGTFNPTYGVVSGSIEEHSAACQCIYCIRSAVGDGENLYSDMEQDIAVRNIEGYRMNENYMESQEASESERRRAPEVREVSEAEGRRAPEVRGVSEDQSQSNTVTKKHAEFQIEVLSEGCAFGYDEEGTNSSTRYLDLNSSPRGYFPIHNFSNSMVFPSEQNGPSSPRVLYTTSPSLAGVLVSPVFVVSEEHMHSKTESKDDNHDQEPPCTPPYGAFRHSNVTKDLSPFVVPRSPGGLSLVMGGSPGQFQMEDFSQSPNSQESQSTAFGVITEDALNYIGATISPFATPLLDFLPSFIDLSPSQVIPEQTSVQEEHHEPNEPNVTGVTDFTDVGLTSVAASVEIPAESTDEATQRKPRKKRKSLTKGQDQTESAKKPRRYKKVKSPVQKKDQDRTDYLSLSPIQTWSSLNDYNTFKTPSPRIRGKKVKQTSDGDASEVIDNESDCVPLCPLPKKRGRKPKKSQNAECKRQLMNEEPLSGLSEGYRVATDVTPKRGRKRNGDSLVTGSGRGRKKKEM